MSEVIAFNVIGTPILYVGRVLTDDVENGRLVLVDALMGLSEKGTIQLVAIPCSGRDSKVEIPTHQVAGIKITQPNEDLVKAYENAIVRAHSKLALS
jgi:hypothetical protein